MLTIRGLLSVLVFILRILLTAGVTGKSVFVVERDRKISTSWYRAYATYSLKECVAFCQVSVECTAANYMLSTGMCFLFTKICFRTKDAPGWNYLRLPLARRTFHYISARNETWIGAKGYCHSVNGDLANIYSLTDYENILSLVRPTKTLDANVWIGGSDISIEGEWTWSNGCRFVDQDFNLWGPDQPNNWKGRQNCLELYMKFSETNQLNDRSCETKQTFVCEIAVA